MNRKLFAAGFLGAALTATTIATPVAAQLPGVPGIPSLGLSIGLKAGSLGIGLDVSKKLVPHLGARLNFNYLKLGFPDMDLSGLAYSADLKLTSVAALVDLYLIGPIRVSAGLAYNGNQVSVVTDPISGTVSLGSGTFQAADIATVRGTVGYAKKVAPYLSVGLGGRGKIGFILEAGAMFTGDIDLTYTGTMNPGVPAAVQTQFNTQIQNETTSVESDLNGKSYLKLWPVVALGLQITI